MTNTLHDNHGNIIMIFHITMILVKNIHSIAICHIGSFEINFCTHKAYTTPNFSILLLLPSIYVCILCNSDDNIKAKINYTDNPETIMISYIMKENIMILLYHNSVQLYCGVHIALKIVLVFRKQKHNFYV